MSDSVGLTLDSTLNKYGLFGSGQKKTSSL